MLSIQPLKSAQGAVEYYTAAYNYYASDATAMRYLGKGREILKLDGVVEKETMLALLEGRLPNGQVLQNPKGEHRPGFDMTFTAPKSVSLLVGLGVAPKMVDYHDRAVALAVGQIEQEFAEARVMKEGQIEFVKTGNLTITAFRQPSSRANDPNLHTHCVVMNMTFLDGLAKSLSSDIYGNHGVVEQLQRNLHYAGLIYRHHLANFLKEDGYQLRFAGDGLFEIEGISEDVLWDFSKRRQEIEQTMDEKGWEGGQRASQATLLTREGKEELSLEFLEAEWQSRAKELGFNGQLFVANRADLKPKTSWFAALKEKLFGDFYCPHEREAQDAMTAVYVGMEVLSQKTSVFSAQDLKAESMKHALISERPISQQAIDKTIALKKQDQSLYEARCPYTNKPQLTTPWLLTLEAETLARINANKGTVASIATKKEVESFQRIVDSARDKPLTQSQKSAMTVLLTSNDRYLAIQGYAGVAKTTMLNHARELIEEKGYHVRGITVASSAAQEMTKKAGIHCDVFPVVHRELLYASNNSLKKTVFIVDEASMLSSPQGHELAKLIEQKGARLVFVGDDAQLPTVKNGRMFGLIQDYEVETSVMDEIVRQRNQLAKESVEHASRGEIYDALKKVNEVRELKTHDERIEHMATSWLNLSRDVRARTLMFAPTHANRTNITTLIREGLEKEGVLNGEKRVQTVLRTRALEDIQTRSAGYYQTGNIIRFNQDFKRQHITSGNYLTVGELNATHRRDNILPLIREDGRQLSFPLKELPQYKTHTAAFSRVMEIYQKAELELQEGDTILWCRNFKHDGIHNSERATLLEMKEDSYRFKLDCGAELNLESNHPALKHLDHGYVLTNYKVQGKDSYYGMGLIESYHQFSATLENFYVQISRAVFSMTLVTDDKTRLTQALELNTSGKKSALDSVSSAELSLHQDRFKELSKSIAMDSVIDKKSMKEAAWSRLEEVATHYQDYKKTGRNTPAIVKAHTLLSSPEGIRLANSRMGFHYKTYRNDAMKLETLRLEKGLNESEKPYFQAVKHYVELHQKTGSAWGKVQQTRDNALLKNQRSKAFDLSVARNTEAHFILNNLDACKPFLKHFSIGELNRYGVPQYRYDEEGAASMKRLVRLGEHAAHHALYLKVDDFLARDADNKGQLACDILEQSKAAHPYIVSFGEKTKSDVSAAWRDIRHTAREFEDANYRHALPESKKELFDLLKSYKAIALDVGQAWKAAFKSQASGAPLPPDVLMPIEQLARLKEAVAHEVLSNKQDSGDLFTFLKLDKSTLEKPALNHIKREQVALFLKPAVNFQALLATAKTITEDIKGYYPLIKQMDVDTDRLGRFMSVASRQAFLNTLSAPEKEQSQQLANYQYVTKIAGRAWKAYFREKEQGGATKDAMNKAVRESANRDALAYKLVQSDGCFDDKSKELGTTPRIQEHANTHLKRMNDLKNLQTTREDLLTRLEQPHQGMNADYARTWQEAWSINEQNIERAIGSHANHRVLSECSLDIPMSSSVKTLLQTLKETSPYHKESPSMSISKEVKSSKGSGLTSMPTAHLDAALINDILMANPETTYRTIFGEPKTTSAGVMDYPGGLKVTIKGSKAGLWNHFVEMQGGAPIQAIMYARQVDFKDALNIAAEIAGHHADIITPVRQGVVHRLKEPNDELKRQSAKSIWDGTKPLNKSLAEKYLKTHRGISDISSLNDVRYWPVGAIWNKMDDNGKLIQSVNKIPALVLGARNNQMEIAGVQRIYLDKDTGGKNRFMSAAKLSCGVMKGSAGIIQKGDKNGRVYIAEGPETGASIAQSFPKATVLVSFSVGNISNLVEVVKVLNPKELIIAGDNDGNHTKAAENTRMTTKKAVMAFQEAGLPTRAIYPNAIKELKKTDWNDVLKHEGVASVRAQLEVNTRDIKPTIQIKNVAEVHEKVRLKEMEM